MTDTKPFNMVVQSVLIIVMAALPVALLMQWFMFYFDQRLELQKSEIPNCI
jgi:hypothetical protein